MYKVYKGYDSCTNSERKVPKKSEVQTQKNYSEMALKYSAQQQCTHLETWSSWPREAAEENHCLLRGGRGKPADSSAWHSAFSENSKCKSLELCKNIKKKKSAITSLIVVHYHPLPMAAICAATWQTSQRNCLKLTVLSFCLFSAGLTPQFTHNCINTWADRGQGMDWGRAEKARPKQDIFFLRLCQLTVA